VGRRRRLLPVVRRHEPRAHDRGAGPARGGGVGSRAIAARVRPLTTERRRAGGDRRGGSVRRSPEDGGGGERTSPGGGALAIV